MFRRAKPVAFRSPFSSLDLPLDILPPILEQLSDRKDWHACALVNKIFNRIANPLLYRTLDSRVISTVSIFIILSLAKFISGPARLFAEVYCQWLLYHPAIEPSTDNIFRQSLIHHPSTTLLKRPDLAQYVRHVTETGKMFSPQLVKPLQFVKCPWVSFSRGRRDNRIYRCCSSHTFA